MIETAGRASPHHGPLGQPCCGRSLAPSLSLNVRDLKPRKGWWAFACRRLHTVVCIPSIAYRRLHAGVCMLAFACWRLHAGDCMPSFNRSPKEFAGKNVGKTSWRPTGKLRRGAFIGDVDPRNWVYNAVMSSRITFGPFSDEWRQLHCTHWRWAHQSLRSTPRRFSQRTSRELHSCRWKIPRPWTKSDSSCSLRCDE